jgi:hypothetical protein
MKYAVLVRKMAELIQVYESPKTLKEGTVAATGYHLVGKIKTLTTPDHRIEQPIKLSNSSTY